MQAINVKYPARPAGSYRHSNIANFGLVLLYRYPQLLRSDFEHDQITGIAARDLRKWWNTRGDLKKAYAENRLRAALAAAAAEPEIERTVL